MLIVISNFQNSFSILAQEDKNIFPLFDFYGGAS